MKMDLTVHLNHLVPKVNYVPRNRTYGRTDILGLSMCLSYICLCVLLSNSGQHLKNRTMIFAIFV